MNWKDLIWEEEPKSSSAAVPAVKPESVSPIARPTPQNQGNQSFRDPASMSPSSVNDEAYNRLSDKTNIENSIAYKQLKSFLDPLASVITDPDLRFKAAFAQAKSMGLSREKFLSSFEDMLSTLNDEQNAFLQMVEAKTQSDITAKEAETSKIDHDIEDLQRQIMEISKQRTKLQAEVSTSRVRIETAKSQFANAFERRKIEIEQLQKSYSNILK